MNDRSFEEEEKNPPSDFAKAFASGADFTPIRRTITAMLGAPEARVSLSDARSVPLSVSLCVSAVHRDGLLIVEDAAEDARFQDNPFVTGAPHVRFYASVPLTTSDGTYLGSLCVIDDEPHAVSDSAREVLEDMASIVTNQFELYQRNREGDAPGDSPSPNGRPQVSEASPSSNDDRAGTESIEVNAPVQPRSRFAGDGKPSAKQDDSGASSSNSAPEEDSKGEEPSKTQSIFGDGPPASPDRDPAEGTPAVSISETYSAPGHSDETTPPPEDPLKAPSRQQEAPEDEGSLLEWKSVFEEELLDVSFIDPLDDLREKLAAAEPEEGEIALVGHLEMPDGETITLPEEPLHRALDRVLRNSDYDTLMVSVQLADEHVILRITERENGFAVEKA